MGRSESAHRRAPYSAADDPRGRCSARVGAEDEKLRPGCDSATGGAGRAAGAEGVDGVAVDVPLAGKRRRSAGSAERLSEDEKGAGAGAVQGHPLPRSAPPVCQAKTKEYFNFHYRNSKYSFYYKILKCTLFLSFSRMVNILLHTGFILLG